MNEFLIQKETLTNIADKFRDYLYEVGDNTHTIDPQFKSTQRYLAQGAVNFTFYEEFDAAGYPADQGTYADGSVAGGFTLWDMRENDKGHLVPVIISQGMVDNQEDEVSAYYYVGVDVVEGVAYDKWRRIEGVNIDTGGEPDPDENYMWESPFRSYLYTNRIVVPVGENTTQYNPTEFDTKIDDVYTAGAASGNGGSGGSMGGAIETCTVTFSMGQVWDDNMEDYVSAVIPVAVITVVDGEKRHKDYNVSDGVSVIVTKDSPMTIRVRDNVSNTMGNIGEYDSTTMIGLGGSVYSVMITSDCTISCTF